MTALIVDQSKCTKCGVCLRVCPAGLIGFGEAGLPEINPRMASHCFECGHCALFCPACANSLDFLKEEDMVKVSDIKTPSEEEALNLLASRRSTRRFKPDPLSKEHFAKIMEAVRMAPTACNDQPVRWIISSDPEKTKEITNLILCWLRGEIFEDPTARTSLVAAHMIALAKAGEDGLLRGAPNAAIAVVPKAHRWYEDGAIALTYMELAAHGVGAGVCWGGFLTMAIRSFKELREYLGVGEDEHVCGAQLLGYPQLKPVRQYPPRRELTISWL